MSVLQNWKLVRKTTKKNLQALGSETEIWRDEIGLLSLSRIGQEERGHFRLRFSYEIALDIFTDRNLIIEISSPSNSPSTTLDHFLADQVVPRILAHEGKFVIHAGSTRIGDRAVILMGATGRGKSTLSASFDQSGGSLIGDDALVVSWQDDVPHVSAVYPSLRLLPDSIDALFHEAPPSTAVASFTQKQRIDLPVKADSAQPVQIAAIFVLAEPTSDSAIKLRRLSAGKACIACITNSFALDPTDLDRARAKLERASALAFQVPVFELSYPRDYAKLTDVHAAILAQLP